MNPESGIGATDSCILIACLPEVDGQTQITLGPDHEVDPGSDPAFEGELDTPTRRVQVVTVEWRPLLEAPVSNLTTRIRVWKNHPLFPDRIVIGFK